MSSAHHAQAPSARHHQVPQDILPGVEAPMLRHLRALASNAKELTKEDIDSGTTYGGFLPAVYRLIEAYESSLSVAEATGQWADPPASWSPINIRREPVEGSLTIFIGFPASDDEFFHTVGSGEEATEAVGGANHLDEDQGQAGMRKLTVLSQEAHIREYDRLVRAPRRPFFPFGTSV